MDSARIDGLSRALADSRSRRSAVVALLGGALGLLGIAETEAKKKKPCPPCKKRKQGKCKVSLPNGTACPGGTCQGGAVWRPCLAPPANGRAPGRASLP